MIHEEGPEATTETAEEGTPGHSTVAGSDGWGRDGDGGDGGRCCRGVTLPETGLTIKSITWFQNHHLRAFETPD